MHSGSCLCGQVRYQISGPLLRTSSCYCNMCRKQHGAAFATYANVASADFAYTAGADLVVAYQSSPGVDRCFCKVCGSTLTWQMDGQRDVVGITLGTFDTPLHITRHAPLYIDERAPWDTSVSE